MGLALHNSSDALELLSQDLPQVGRLRPGTHYRGAYLRVDGTLSLSREHAHQRLPLLDLILLRNHQRETTQRPRQTRRRHQQQNRSIQQWRYDEAAEGRALAAIASVRLPGSSLCPQRRRTPSLERQNAFCEPRKTNKSRMAQRAAQEEKDIAELYRLGLLFDDEHVRGEEFELHSIVHSEPGYTMRPAKKAHKSTAQEYSFEDDLQFALDLSLAELGHDESFASYLLPPGLDEISSADESTDSSPSHFISEPVSSPHSLNDDLPDLTTDSDSDHASLDSSSIDECWTTPHSKDGTSRIGDVVDHDVSDDACIGLGDGS
ncbi:uncharacterized protein CTRU02_213079 [Colletotrichum truncatum]|uniref:Uncharacterized protein n=1 Tax=Colletotrichum truncatum TaxID=5467 RepID=A0ACC3YJP3_COLTU|nr:uncharacterized protein CTRU02_03401 [Colletotrichum truncatum]KAF6797370.1 hypothetical protein CTRU02_03401 [Colletotrichum truncatum]